MSNSINNGGPAFPVTLDHRGCVGAYGMSLRDWFAGQALSNLAVTYMADCRNQGDAAFALAKECYTVADAMLEARNKEVAP